MDFPILVRVPVALLFHDVIDMHVFGLAKRVQAFFSELASNAAPAHSAERTCIVVGQRVVHPERAGLDVLHRPHRELQVLGEDRGAEAVFGIVRLGDRLVGVLGQKRKCKSAKGRRSDIQLDRDRN